MRGSSTGNGFGHPQIQMIQKTIHMGQRTPGPCPSSMSDVTAK